ncbi:tyrosine-protein phosphatase 2/3 [Microdochium nivale]|nr:tyrosine-protein phosphatase 2/3 [Microdochium nivale]
MPPDSPRSSTDRSTTQHYTMKTAKRPVLNSAQSSQSSHAARHSHSNGPQSLRLHRALSSSVVSPRASHPHPVGHQPYPPPSKLSPSISSPERRVPSPNYFGLNVERNSSPRDSGTIPENNWSPPTSSVRSFAAAIPQQIPLDANPEFEAFRRQIDANRSRGFNLGEATFSPAPQISMPSPRPRPTHRATHHSEISNERLISKPLQDGTSTKMDVDTNSLHNSAHVSANPKRNSEVAFFGPQAGGVRYDSPASMDSPFDPTRRSNLTSVDDRHPRLSLPQNKLELAGDPARQRAQTSSSSTLQGGPGMMPVADLKDLLKSAPATELLILDVRVSTHYSQARIRGALNLCIPTTLLKRATFNIEKLLQTLQTDEDREKFQQWRQTKHLIVYDVMSSEQRDAAAAMNMLKKFANEGYEGTFHLLQGGFAAFSKAFPDFVDNSGPAARAGQSSSSAAGGRPSFAPVIGGVMLPANSDGANPFFSNIRQNMDLADGVGQMDVKLPTGINLDVLPDWLKSAADPADHGKKVSERFLKIEKGEQARMRAAYAGFNTAVPSSRPGSVQLSGVEKGGKNRYKDILPFEHSRVHLAGRPEGSCDYINASHIQLPKSNKRYIASQGPLPATFDDFWSVVWDQDVRVIVMLTAETEGGQLKCHPYWKERDFGLLKLKPLSEKKVSLDIDRHRSSSAAQRSSAMSSGEASRRRANTTTQLDSAPTPAAVQSQTDAPYVVIRKFALVHSAHPFAPVREITHLHYPSWPDFGAPAQPSHLLALVELANVMQRAALPVETHTISSNFAADQSNALGWYDEPVSEDGTRPILVHCSAGCGRTGAFCTVDSVIDMLKRQHQASLNSAKQKDADGDVSMTDEAISPRTVAARTLDEQLKLSPTHLDDKEHAEPGWVHNESLDLIEETVNEFRQQRLSMVQSLRQYVLCYESIAEWVARVQEQKSSSAAPSGRARSGSLNGH